MTSSPSPQDEPMPLPDDVLERARRLSTTLLSDAMESAGTMDHEIKPIGSGMTMVGPAVTVELESGDNLFLHAVISMGKAGFVLVADGKGYMAKAYLGELIARAAKKAGFAGIVIDGAARDRIEMVRLGLPVFARGFVPSGPSKNGPGKINVPIVCAGVTVHPGDLVMGDDNGVVVVPRDRIEQVLAKAEKKASYEQARRQQIEAGQIAPPWLEESMRPYRAQSTEERGRKG